jgi:hypothetical protein
MKATIKFLCLMIIVGVGTHIIVKLLPNYTNNERTAIEYLICFPAMIVLFIKSIES